jgi:hypothetical protein
MPNHASAAYAGPYMFGEDGLAGSSAVEAAQGSFAYGSSGVDAEVSGGYGGGGFAGVDYGPLTADPGALSKAFEFMQGMWD